MTERFGYVVLDLREGELGIDFAFGLAHVAHDDKASAISEYLLQGGEGAADTGVVGDLAVLVERHVEVNADDGFLAVEIKIVDCHNIILLKYRFSDYLSGCDSLANLLIVFLN